MLYIVKPTKKNFKRNELSGNKNQIKWSAWFQNDFNPIPKWIYFYILCDVMHFDLSATSFTQSPTHRQFKNLMCNASPRAQTDTVVLSTRRKQAIATNWSQTIINQSFKTMGKKWVTKIICSIIPKRRHGQNSAHGTILME